MPATNRVTRALCTYEIVHCLNKICVGSRDRTVDVMYNSVSEVNSIGSLAEPGRRERACPLTEPIWTATHARGVRP